MPSQSNLFRLIALGLVFFLVACAADQDIPESGESVLEESLMVPTENSEIDSAIGVAVVDDNTPLVLGVGFTVVESVDASTSMSGTSETGNTLDISNNNGSAEGSADINTETNSTDNKVTTEETTTGASGDSETNLYSYMVLAGFSPQEHLLTEEIRQWHQDWWELYNNPNSFYQDTPSEILSAGDLTNSASNGTYSYARAGSHFLQGLVDFIRTTGDPAALDELVLWSERLALNLKDHDGRGYKFFQYMNGNFGSGYDQAYNPKNESTDTNFLDEQMLAGTIALIAHAMHENRSVSSAAGTQADMWFDYLANNWVPKWLARSTVNSSNYQPPVELNLHNAVNWTHPTNPQHDDTHPSFNPTDSDWTPADDNGKGPNHLFPIRQYGHPYLMSLFQYWAMGEYFSDGTGSAVTTAFSTADFVQEAQTREDWWYQQTTLNSDGSRDSWLHMQSSNAGLDTKKYGVHVSTFLNALHFNQVGKFASDASMVEYAKALYNGENAGNTDVYNKDDTQNMQKFTNGGGANDKFSMRSNAYLMCWDDTGELESLTKSAIISPLKHHIYGSTSWADFSHYNALISCALSRELEGV